MIVRRVHISSGGGQQKTRRLSWSESAGYATFQAILALRLRPLATLPSAASVNTGERFSSNSA